MHRYEATIRWSRNQATFTDNRYSRKHEWSFDGGVRVVASSSPTVVPVPYSTPEAVDPEEALIASTSSCHMLWFLYFAARQGFIVDGYADTAVGTIEKDAAGKMAFTRITLRPQIQFSGEKVPSPEDMITLHHAAHDACYIANSLKCDVVVEPG